MAAGNVFLTSFIESRLTARNELSHQFFSKEASKLAHVSQQMAERFKKGGRLFAFGRGPFATDAQHVSVEFVHPVVVGKKALPAIDVSATFEHGLNELLYPDDMAMGFGPPNGDPVVDVVLKKLAQSSIYTISLPGTLGDYSIQAPTHDLFVYQEIVEILYHTLWETVHVFLEHETMGHDVGAANFLYPFLTDQQPETALVTDDVATSIEAKATEDEGLRLDVAKTHAEHLAKTTKLVNDRLKKGGKIIVFGNGGSATDANDFAIDCMNPPNGQPAFPAISLSTEPAILSALANDLGPEFLFLRQLIAHQKQNDIAIALSTSGNSLNIIATLKEARKTDLLTIAILGCDGGEIARQKLADILITIPSNYIPRIQEIQASVYHTLIEALYELNDVKN